MRNKFVSTLMDLAASNSKIMLLTGDLGFGVFEPFRDQFPKQFLNVGIAEQNMAGIAAGLAKEGRTVFFYSIGNFPTLRCLEQIRYDICYHNLDVKIISVGAGYAYGPLGVSHHTTEDISILRSIPNLKVAAPGDPVEVDALVRYFAHNKLPSYMRLNKSGEMNIHNHKLDFKGNEILKVLNTESAYDVAILSTGAILEYAYKFITNHKKNWSLFSCPFVDQQDENILEDIFLKYKKIITIEENQLNGGFGSAILEKVNDMLISGRIKNSPSYIHRIGIPNIFIPTAGTQDHLRSKAGITLEPFL